MKTSIQSVLILLPSLVASPVVPLAEAADGTPVESSVAAGPVAAPAMRRPGTPRSALAPVAQPWRVTKREAHQNIWEATSLYTNREDGSVMARPQRFVELASGLNMLNEQGEFVPARAVFEITDGGVEARQTSHRVRLPADIGTPFGVEVTLPEGVKIMSHPLLIWYYSPSSGQTIVLGAVTNAVGWLTAPNEVVYSNCFSGGSIQGSIRYRITRTGFEQDLLISAGDLPEPGEYGLGEDTRAELITEFAPDTPEPAVKTLSYGRAIAGSETNRLTDTILAFGSMQMGRGRAFVAADRGQEVKAKLGGLRVDKEFSTLSGRKVLIESVSHRQLKRFLEKSAGPNKLGAALRPKESKVQLLASAGRVLPARLAAKTLTPNARIRMAWAGAPGRQEQASVRPPQRDLAAPSLVWDYIFEFTNTIVGPFVFKADTTYFVDGYVGFPADVTFEGGSVLKFGNETQCYLEMGGGGPVTCQTGPYRPIVLTSKDDDTIGVILPQSTGSPAVDQSGNFYLAISGNETIELQHLRMSYGSYGMALYDANNVRLNHAQFTHMGTVLYAQCTYLYGDSLDLRARNILMYDVQRGLELSDAVACGGEHWTLHQCGEMAYAWTGDCTLALTNSVLVGVTSPGNMSYATNVVVSLGSNETVL